MTPLNRRTRTRLVVVTAISAAVAALPLVPQSTAAADPVLTVGDFEVDADFVLDVADARVRPLEFTALTADLAGLGASLAAAPSEAQAARGAAGATITIPDPQGEPVKFAVVEVPVMEPGLAAEHPDIRTYAGNAVEDPTTIVALDLGPNGFHAAVRDLGGDSWYVDPAYNDQGVVEHLSYYVDDVTDDEPFEEKGLVKASRKAAKAETGTSARIGEEANAEVMRRTYRLAMVTDFAYTTYFGEANVMAEKATMVNRVNQIYNADFAIRLVMVDDTDEITFTSQAAQTGPNGPCGANACYTAEQLSSCSGELLDRNTFVLGQIIGADRFDVGHIALGGGGGGIAGLGVVGKDRKAEGCTGLETPDGDFFAVDFVAHEIGHQFNGNHTFNGTNGSCAGINRNGETSIEPGSGSSVMGYAGICFSDDLQPHTDPFFSQRSIVEFNDLVTETPTDYAEVQTVNLSGFDTNGDAVTLTWPPNEQSRTFTRGTNYDNATIQSELRALTGNPGLTVSGYDGGESASDAGFTVTWPVADGDRPRFGVGATGAGAFLGVQLQGGPSTNAGTPNASGNRAPSVTAPADKTIPQLTPFQLTGSGTDLDGDPLVYLWEQNNPGLYLISLGEPGDPLPLATRLTGPLFRIFGDDAVVSDADALEYMSNGQNLADGNPSRVFPDMAQILANNTNAEEGVCTPAPFDPTSQLPDAFLDCQSELLPTAAWMDNDELAPDLKFRLTARDQKPLGGGTQFDDVVLTVGPAGPFLVSSRGSAGAPATGGATETVTWTVAGTDSETYATEVKITLSTDGGVTWPITLAESTANDGSHEVTLPEVSTTKARIKVEAIGNYFFDVNNADFVIDSGSTGNPGTNTAPTARIKASDKRVFIGQEVSLFGNQSSDAETPDELDYSWDFGNQGKKVDATGPTATAKYGKRGFRTVTLTVTDPDGLSDTDTARIRVFKRTDCEDDPVFRSQGWKVRSDKQAFGKKYCKAKALPAKSKKKPRRMVLPFSGTSLQIDYATAKRGGVAVVFIDGERVGKVKFRGPTKALTFGASKKFKGLKKGTHTMRLVLKRGKGWVDTFSY